MKEMLVELAGYRFLVRKDNGPGPNKLAAFNEKYAGFFGETLSSELITGTALAAMVDLTVGTNHSEIDTIPWLKFALDNKILFVSKKCFKYNLSWSSLSAIEVVSGNKIITIGSYQYRIRLLKTIGPNADNVTWTTQNDSEFTHGSEWNRLMYNILPEFTAG